MDTKLTLKLDEAVIQKAKAYAAKKKLSLSMLVENYLKTIVKSQEEEFELSPFVKSISTGKSIPGDIKSENDADEYIEYLDKKYT